MKPFLREIAVDEKERVLIKLLIVVSVGIVFLAIMMAFAKMSLDLQGTMPVREYEKILNVDADTGMVKLTQ
jgi:hypothetical protein